MSHPTRTPEPETRMLERQTSGSSLTGFALIKYTAMIIITLAILYFVATYLLPGIMPGAEENGEAVVQLFLG